MPSLCTVGVTAGRDQVNCDVCRGGVGGVYAGVGGTGADCAANDCGAGAVGIGGKFGACCVCADACGCADWGAALAKVNSSFCSS